MRIFGIVLIVWAVVFGIFETIYFGNNLFPSSIEEFICDMTSLVLYLAGYLLIKNSKR